MIRVERRSRYTLLGKVASKYAQPVAATIALLARSIRSIKAFRLIYDCLCA